MKKFKIILFVFLPLFFSSDVFSEDQKYIFGWTQLQDADLKKPRGGTSIGAVSYTHLTLPTILLV